MKAKDIKIVEDYKGNKFLQVDTDTPYKEEKKNHRYYKIWKKKWQTILYN